MGMLTKGKPALDGEPLIRPKKPPSTSWRIEERRQMGKIQVKRPGLLTMFLSVLILKPVTQDSMLNQRFG